MPLIYLWHTTHARYTDVTHATALGCSTLWVPAQYRTDACLLPWPSSWCLLALVMSINGMQNAAGQLPTFIGLVLSN